MTPPRRRKERSADVGLSTGAQIYLGLAAERVAAADLAPEGSDEALALAQEAIGYTAYAVSRHLHHAEMRTGSERDGWLEALRFLSGTGIFRYRLEMLTLALTELDRGIVVEGLKKRGTAQGGRSSIKKLGMMKLVVEIADELVRQHDGSKGKAEAFIEDEAGLPATTLRAWRRQLARLSPEHRPRSFRRWMPRPPLASHETPDQKRERLSGLVEALISFRHRMKKDIL